MGRAPCCEKAHTNKGAWSREEDQRLVDYIRVHGEGCWRSLPKAAGLMRCGKSCRLRWINYLRPDLKRGNFSDEDDELIISLHASLGNKWSQIAARMPGRTDNEIKNYWNTHIKRKLLSRGLDPQTHQPLNPSENSISGVTSDEQLVAPPPPPPPSAPVLPKPAETITTERVKEEPLDLELSLAVKPSINHSLSAKVSVVTAESKSNQQLKYCLSCRVVYPQRPSVVAECSNCGSPFFRYL